MSVFGSTEEPGQVVELKQMSDGTVFSFLPDLSLFGGRKGWKTNPPGPFHVDVVRKVFLLFLSRGPS